METPITRPSGAQTDGGFSQVSASGLRNCGCRAKSFASMFALSSEPLRVASRTQAARRCPCASWYALGLRSPSRGHIRLRSTSSLRYVLPSEGVAFLRHRSFTDRGVRRRGIARLTIPTPIIAEGRHSTGRLEEACLSEGHSRDFGWRGWKSLILQKPFLGFWEEGVEKACFCKIHSLLSGKREWKKLVFAKSTPCFLKSGSGNALVNKN